MFCPYCGKEQLEEAVYCGSCGKKLKEEGAFQQIPLEPNNNQNNYQNNIIGKKQNDTHRKMMIVIPIVAVLLFGIIVATLTVTSYLNPSASIESQGGGEPQGGGLIPEKRISLNLRTLSLPMTLKKQNSGVTTYTCTIESIDYKARETSDGKILVSFKCKGTWNSNFGIDVLYLVLYDGNGRVIQKYPLSFIENNIPRGETTPFTSTTPEFYLPSNVLIVGVEKS